MSERGGWIVGGVLVAIALVGGIVFLATGEDEPTQTVAEDPCAMVSAEALALTFADDLKKSDVITATSGHDPYYGAKCAYRRNGKVLLSVRAREIGTKDLAWVALTDQPPPGEAREADTKMCGAIVRTFANVTHFVGERWTYAATERVPDSLARSLAASVAHSNADSPPFVDRRASCEPASD